MDHVTRLAQALSYDDTRSLLQSEMQSMSADELIAYIYRKDRAIEEPVEKTAGSTGDAAKIGVGKVLRAAKGASKSTAKRAATGAAAGAAGGAATELSKKEPTKGGVAKGIAAGAAAGAAGGAASRPGAKAILKMKGPVGEFARKSVFKSRIYDFVKAVKKPFTKTATEKNAGFVGGMAQNFLKAKPLTRMAGGAALGAGVGTASAGQGNRTSGALGGAGAGAMAGFAAPSIVKRISRMAGPKINRQGTGMMGKLLPAGGPGAAAKQTINATRL